MEERKPVSEAQKRASAKYVKANYDEIKVRVPKGKKTLIQEHSHKMGESVSSFINRAIRETMLSDANK
jgi:uncharacterized protein (DUF1778 family)